MRRIWPIFLVVSGEKNMHGKLEKIAEFSGIYFSALIDRARFYNIKINSGLL